MYSPPTQKVMDSKLYQFVGLTGADPELAKDILKEHNWNVEVAAHKFKCMQSNTRKPPPKNVNMEVKKTTTGVVSATVGGGNPAPIPGSPQRPGALKSTSTTGTSDTMTPVESAQQFQKYVNTEKTLKRGLSKTSENMMIVNKARDTVLHDISEDQDDHVQHLLEMPEYTFILPDLTVYSEDFRAFLHKDLIETSTLVSLEQAGRLNWWADIGACQRLWPLATTGDGNCLLHAASLGMWGFHDRLLTLRSALFNTLTKGPVKGALWRRWRWHQTIVNRQSCLVYSEKEWEVEWNNLLRLSSTKPRCLPGTHSSCCNSAATQGLMEMNEHETEDSDVFYESLEEFHVFVLAHVLRRPIIVVADTILKGPDGEALAPIPFGGIYLPLECEPRECHQAPLLLTYDAAHFSALVAMESEVSPGEKPQPPAAIPLVDPDFILLPIHFMVDPGTNFVWGKDENDPQKNHNLELSMEQQLTLLEKYLGIQKVMIPKLGEEANGFHGLLARSDSTTGSVESDDGTNSTGSNGSGKEKDKSKVAKQMQSVGKAFGSIGKTMSKKLKKNFGSIGKSGKNSDGAPQRRASVGSATQSTKVVGLAEELLRDRDHILCAVLSQKQAAHQQEMIKNYLTTAQDRFKEDRELRKKRDAEMKQKTEQRRLNNEASLNRPVPCINPGCQQTGTAATSYLCPNCFAKQKQEAMSLERGSVLPPGVTSSHSADNTSYLVKQNTIIAQGKSKFYTYADEAHSEEPPPSAVKRCDAPLNNSRSQQAENRNSLELARSTFYENPSAQRTGQAVAYAVDPGNRGSLPSSYINNLGGSGVDAPDYKSNIHRVGDEASRSLPNQGPVPTRQKAFKIPEKQVNLAPVVNTAFKEQCKISGNFTPASVNITKGNQAGAHKSMVLVGGDMPRGPCRTQDCPFYGTEATEFLCSSCFKQKQRTLAYISTKR